MDWQSYINVNDDVQILDLFLMIGNPFPLLDEDNREVESDEDVTEPLVKVRLNPHDGMLSSEPLAMEPKQLVRVVFLFIASCFHFRISYKILIRK